MIINNIHILLISCDKISEISQNKIGKIKFQNFKLSKMWNPTKLIVHTNIVEKV